MAVRVTALGPLPCLTCGQLVKWWREDRIWRLRNLDRTDHRCKNAPGAKSPGTAAGGAVASSGRLDD